MHHPQSARASETARVLARSLAVLVLLAALLIPLVTAPAVVAAAAATPRSPTSQSVEPPFGHRLDARMSTLFEDIIHDSLPAADRLFFPESAYVAMKTGLIASPATDYRDRLAAFYRLDLLAYHDYILARGPATFLGVNAASRDAQWIKPGWCENSIGYWHVPGVRLVYRQRNGVRSVAVASLISWHGVWYVVHLGPNPRPQNVGKVDAPAPGRGVAGPAGGC